MAEKEIEVQEANVEESPNVDVIENVDLSNAPEDKTTAAAAPVDKTTAAAPVDKAPKVAAEVPKTPRQKSDELFNRVLMGRDKEINNLLNKWGKDKFYNLVTTNKKFREDFYQDISNRGIKIPIEEYNGYYTPTYEEQKNAVVLSDEGLRQAREQAKVQKEAAAQKEREAQAEKTKPWYQVIPDVLGTVGKSIGDAAKTVTKGLTELAQKSDTAKALKLDKAADMLTDAITNVQRGTAMGEAINETDVTRLAAGYTGFDFDRIAQQMKDVKSYGQTNIEQDFAKHEGAWDTFTDWAKIIGPTVIESFATLGRSGWEEIVATGAVGAPEVGAVMSAYHMELFATIVDEMEAAGYDVTNGNSWRKAFNDKNFIDPTLKKANTRAAIITGVDLIGAGAFGNVGSKLSKLAKRVGTVAPKALTSPIAKGIALAGKAKKLGQYAPIKAVSEKIVQTSEKVLGSEAGKKITKGVTEFVNPQEAIAAGVGEASAQFATTGEIDPEATALEILPEASYIKVLGKLLKRSKGKYTTPSGEAPEGVDVEAEGGPTTYEPVTAEEYEAYRQTGKLDPDRRAGVEDDAKKALQDPQYLAQLQKDAETDEAQKRYLDLVTDEMHTQTKLQESEEIMKAAIAHVAEKNGGISEDDIAEMINPQSPQFKKDISRAVELKYNELMDAYADETGQPELRQTPTQTAAQAAAQPQAPAGQAAPQAPSTEQLPVEVRKSVDAIQRLQEYLQRMEASVPQMTPEQLQKYEASKKSINEVIDKNIKTINRLGYDSENLTGIPSQVGVGQESQQAQPEQVGGTQEAGGSGVLQTPGQEVVSPAPEAPATAITDEARALAAQELSPKNLVKEGKLVYKNRKPVYNGQEFKSTRDLENFLKTDEAILAAAESNEAIANALGKTPTFTPTTTTGVEQQPTTGEAGPSAESMAGVQTAEGATEAAPAEPTVETGKGKEVLPEGVKPEEKPRVKGDSQEVIEAFEKAVAAGKKISFPVSGGRTTVQLDKPGQLKAAEDGELYIDRGKGKREYLPAGGSEESVIRQQLGVAETAESQKQRKEAVAERNKKAKEQEEQKKKAEQEKQTKQKRDYIARLQKVLDTGKDEKGNSLNQRQRKEVEKTIERLKQGIAEAEAAEKLVKGEQPTAETEKPSKKNEIETVLKNLSTDFYKTFGKVVKDGTFIVNNKETFYEVGVLTNFEKGVNAAKTIEAIKKWAESNGLFFVETAYDEVAKADKMKFSSEKPEAKPEQTAAPAKTETTEQPKNLPEQFTKKGGNKIVDKNGNPIKLYHGTQREFDEYQIPSYYGEAQYATEGGAEMGMTGVGAIFFSSNKESAETYSQLDPTKRGYVKEAYINIQNPIIIDANGESWAGSVADGYKNALMLIKNGTRNKEGKLYDGVIVRNVIDSASTKPLVGDVYLVLNPKNIYNLSGEKQGIPTKEIADTDIQKRIQALDPNESQGYQIDRLRAAKEDMLARPARAVMAMQAMDFFTEFYSRNDKKYAEYVEKHPLSTVTQYFYNSEDSIIDMVREQISGKEFDIVRFREQINSLGKSKKDAQLKASYEQSIKDAEQYIKDIKVAYNEFAKANGLDVMLAERKTIPSIIGSDVDAKGDRKNYAFQFRKDEFINKVNESVKSGVFKVDITKSDKKFIATLYNAGGKRLEQVTFERPSDIQGDLTEYATNLLATDLHKNSVLIATIPQKGEAFSQFAINVVSERRMSAQDAVDIILSAGVKVPDNLKLLAEGEKTETTETKVTETETVEETPEIEQYKPLTSKDIEIGKFSKDEALDYETDEKELDSGRMSEYISSMTVDVMDENGDSIGNLIRLKDEDGITSYQATDLDGNELTEDSFDTKQEAIQAILDAYNKQKGKEFSAEQKRKAKAEEKKAAKEAAKAEKAEPVTPVSAEVIESTAESVTDAQMKMIDEIMETERTKPAKAKEMREKFIEMHGKEVFDKLNKITRNFEQIINTLEKEGKCTKRC